MDNLHPNFVTNLLLTTVLVQCTAAVLLTTIWRRRRRLRLHNIHPINQRRNVAGHYNNLYAELRMHPDRFYNYTRMSIDQFDYLTELIEPHMPRRDNIRHRPCPTAMRLVITLRYLASGGLLSTHSYGYRIGVSTCRGFVNETCTALWAALQPIYLKPPTNDDYLSIANEFWERWNLPNCLGAIDGKHIKIRAPPNSGSLYYNYKNDFSVVLMAACDANYCFTLIDIGHCGSNNDGGVFRNSNFGEAILNNTLDVPQPTPLPRTADNVPCPYYFVGDEAFALKQNLMIPYSKVHLVGRSEKAIQCKVFNYRLSRARRIIENTFGIFSAWWRLFYSNINAHPDTVVNYVQACICLHNFLMKTKDRFHQNIPGLHGDVYEEGELVAEGIWRTEVHGDLWTRVVNRANRNADCHSKRYRDYLAHYVSTVGAVPWQFEHIARGMFD